MCGVIALRNSEMNKVEIHKRMIRNVFLNLEILLNDKIKTISEYDVQSFMFLFFTRFLANSEFTVDREKSGKVDCVLFNSGVETSFYELKTYFKSNERFAEKHFRDDVKKLAGLVKKKKQTNGYFVIAALRSKLETKTAQENIAVKAHIDGDRKWKKYDLGDGASVRLRPSVKERKGLCCVMSWEVKL
jgi:hypothetical protein